MESSEIKNGHMIKDVRLTDRSFENYLEDLELTEENLDESKVLLDIGAGTRRFAIEAERKNIKAKIISLEPLLGLPSEELSERNRALLAQYPPTVAVQENTVTDPAEKMTSIADESIDLALCDHSVPLHMQSADQVKMFFSEIRRVIKKGGQVRILPINRDEHGNLLFQSGQPFNKSGLDLYINQQIDELTKDAEFSPEQKLRLLILTKKS